MSETIYNYLDAETQDVLTWIDYNGSLTEVSSRLGCPIGTEDFNWDDLAQALNEALWCEDSVTGNGSGSYTFNARQAAHYVADNLDLLADIVEEWGCDAAEWIRNPESADVAIRCWLLSNAISDALEMLANETEEA